MWRAHELSGNRVKPNSSKAETVCIYLLPTPVPTTMAWI